MMVGGIVAGFLILGLFFSMLSSAPGMRRPQYEGSPSTTPSDGPADTEA